MANERTVYAADDDENYVRIVLKGAMQLSNTDLIQRLQDRADMWRASEPALSAILTEAADALTRLLGAAEPFVQELERFDASGYLPRTTIGDFRALASAVHSVKKIEK